MNDSAIIPSDFGEFFAPTQHGALDSLFGQHSELSARIGQVAAIMASELGGAVTYFVNGNAERDRYGCIPKVDELFDADGAMKALNADFWRRALDLTGVRELMPQEKRGTWDEDIRAMRTPEFTPEWVEPTIRDLLDSRERFFAEKVDGLFRGLSGEHVTNRPEGFGKRFIYGYAYTEGRGWGYPHERFSGYMHDLRMVVATFMGQADPDWSSTSDVLRGVSRDGSWHQIDGGAIRLRAYIKGTAHVEVHPDMAWRLNRVLAYLNPMAIPSRFREPTKSRPREWAAIQRPLPHEVRRILGGCKTRAMTVSLPYLEDKHVRAHAEDALKAIGGVKNSSGDFVFVYDPTEALSFLRMVGTLPDIETHQYYPTGSELAERLVAALGPDDGAMTYLEPSAGQGGIVADLPADRATCVELAEINAIILRSKGFNVHHGDFIAWAKTAPKFDRIAMNPPFSQGRAKAHVEAAGRLLAKGGKLAAILPASMRGKSLIAGASETWSEAIENAFPSVSVAVITYTAELLA